MHCLSMEADHVVMHINIVIKNPLLYMYDVEEAQSSFGDIPTEQEEKTLCSSLH